MQENAFFCDSPRLSHTTMCGRQRGVPGHALPRSRSPKLQHDTRTLPRFHRSFPSVGPFLHWGDLTACSPHPGSLRGLRLREQGATGKKCYSLFEKVSSSMSATLGVSHFESQGYYAPTAVLLQPRRQGVAIISKLRQRQLKQCINLILKLALR